MRIKRATGTLGDPNAFVRKRVLGKNASGWNEPPKEPPLPPKAEMLGNAMSSVVKMVYEGASGNQVKLSKEEAATRLEICNGCEFFRKSDQRCSKCGCFMAIKTYLKAEKCPTGKW